MSANSPGPVGSLVLGEAQTVPELGEASSLFERVWGRGAEGVPVNTDMMVGLRHAGGCVTVARDSAGHLVGAALLAPAMPAGNSYSLIAAVAPGAADAGIGRALKLRQRDWALARGFTSMTWTFDPLVARNARFNLAKLGAVARSYEVAFYGRMTDEINSGDESDRLAAHWGLAGERTRSTLAGSAPDPTGPEGKTSPARLGPDGDVLVRRDAVGLWCRVPSDIMKLRRDDPGLAMRWRLAVRDVLVPAFNAGYVATHFTRSGWYLLTQAAQTVQEKS